MKFSDGAWLWREGVTPILMRRITEYRIQDKELLVWALDRYGREGVDRFEGTVLQLRISSPIPDVIRVQVQHFAPDPRRIKFDLDYSLQADQVKIQDRQDALWFTSGQLTLRLAKHHWEMQFLAEGQPLTAAGHDCLGYMQVRGQGNFLMQRLDLAVGECIYGMGERFGPLVKNGQSVVIWQEDGGTVSDQAYKNIPFYLSSQGYGLLVNDPGRVEFEVCTERVSQIQFSVPGEELDYYVFYGPDLKQVLEKYTRLAGRPALPPAWSFGLWLSTSFTTQYDEKTVNQFVDGMHQRGIPLAVFHFDCFWMKERHWCNFQWDRQAFPDPEGMLRRLKAKGLKICVWINPYISAMSELFEEGRANGYFLKRPDGSVYQRDQWQPAMAIVDFTNPAAVRWYQSKLRALLEMGVDTFKTDFGERIPTDVVYYNGADPQQMHNYYTYLYNKAVFELLEEFHGRGRALVFARSATTGGQKFPVHWGGDCLATFPSMAESLRGGLSFCLSGGAFWSHDIGGFAGKSDPALYKRWVQFGLLSTHSRLHGSESYRVPWLFDEESVQVMRHFARLKNQLFPYLYGAAHEAHEKGWPVMRAMILEFPDDPTCRYLDRQYMLGSALLVAPVFRGDSLAEYYLPAGQWTDFFSGQLVTGGRWIRQFMDFMHLPLYVRENSIIPMSENPERPEWTVRDPLTVHVFGMTDGGRAQALAGPSDGSEPVAFVCRRSGAGWELRSDGRARDVRVLARGQGQPSQISNGQVMKMLPEGPLIRWRDPARPLAITWEGSAEKVGAAGKSRIAAATGSRRSRRRKSR